jgi:hypothetical protein
MATKSTENYVVSGLITEQRGAPLQGLTVRAFDEVPKTPENLLGEVTTDANGRYEITFTEKDFKVSGAERVGPDVFIQVFDGRRILGESPIERHAKEQITIDLAVDLAVEDPNRPNQSVSGADREEEPNFVVTGNVFNRRGGSVKRQRLIALDVDLRGAAVYRTVKSIRETETNGGFEFLAEGLSDINGNYYIEFRSSQYARAERKKADVIVYAVNKQGEIVGRSRLVNSREYSDQGLVRNLDVLITKTEDRTEYELLMSKLLPFLEESKVRLNELGGSNDQVLFTAAELDKSEAKIQIAADAESLRTRQKENGRETVPENCKCEDLSHELLYGLGRQQIILNWVALYQKTDRELQTAIEQSAKEKIIKEPNEQEIALFLRLIHDCAAAYILQYRGANQTVTLETILSAALPKKEQQEAFVNAYRNFKSEYPVDEQIDYKKFWSDYLPEVNEFKENPKLISGLLLAQQLNIIGGSHQPLINELQVNRKISSVTELISLGENDWRKIISKTGVPDLIAGETVEEKTTAYVNYVQSFLNAAYPTQKIAVMVRSRELPIRDPNVSERIFAFLDQNTGFDIGASPVHEYADEIKAVAKEHYDEVKLELNRLQRIFQVSPKPQVMRVLMEKDLNSAYSISSIPKKSFIKLHAQELGGETVAETVYQRAQHISTLAAERAMKMYDLSHLAAPALVYSTADREAALSVLQEQVSKRHNPNYSEIFGSPDICECEHCRSVYSAAAYFVDLLRFLWRGAKNSDGFSPLDMFVKRRPDLLHLPLTCENTNTVIPYIDLVNEVMEYYTFHGLLDKHAAYDTGQTTADELRANPQNFEPRAYRILKDAVYPFSLPYHQPLDVIRTYSDHLKTERYEIMKRMQRDFSPPAVKAIEAEALRISEEEYRVLTLTDFNGAPDVDQLSAAVPKPVRQLQQYFGFSFSSAPNPELDPVVIANLEKVAGNGVADGIHEFLRRTGIKYTELVDLIETKFINPHRNILEFLERLFSAGTMKAQTIYTKLQQINAGTLDPSTDTAIMAVLAGKISPADFTVWVQDHFDEFDSVITLYQSKSMCDLNTTYLKTVKNVYAAAAASGVTNATWSKIHRFIRLWRKLGWKIYEVDLMLTAFGESGINDLTITKLSSAGLLNKHLKLPINKLATVWGSIDTATDQSLYKKLFLNKAVQRIDSAFQADEFGNYLTDTTKLLADHIPAILAAFRMSEEDLNAIIEVAEVSDAGVDRPLNPATEELNIHILSLIYRYTVLSKALKLKVSDFCLLTRLFNRNPFSVLSIPAPAIPPAAPVFAGILPSKTLEFYELAAAVKKTGFKASVLQYIFSGQLAPESKLGLDPDKVKQTARVIRDSFVAIEQSYPETPAAPLTTESLRTILSLSFKTDIVTQLIGIIVTRQSFSVLTEATLPIAIPVALASKYTYVSASGELTSAGIMSDAERIDLKSVGGANDNFKNAVDALFIQSRTLATGSPAYSIVTDANLSVVIPDVLSPKFTYTKASGRLTCTGVMSDAEKSALGALPGVSSNFIKAVGEIYKMPEDFVRQNFSGVFAAANAILMNSDFMTLLDHPVQPVEKTLEEKLLFVYSNYLPLLKKKLREDVIVQHIASLIGLSQEATLVLIKTELTSLIEAVTREGFSAEYFANSIFTGPAAVKRTDRQLKFDWGSAAPYLTVPANSFSVRWQSYLSPPSSGEYTLVVAVKEADEAFKLYLDDVLIREKPAANPDTSLEVPVELNASQMYKLAVEYSESVGNAGISLYWKTPTSAPAIVPSTAAFPAKLMEDFISTIELYHRVGKFVSGFKLTDTEVNHFVDYKTDFGNIDFNTLTPDHWQRVNDYVALRNAVPQGQALLTDVFAAANISDPPATVNSLSTLLNLATAWDLNTLNYLVNSYFTLTVNDFKNEIALAKLFGCIAFVLKTGLSPQTLEQWAAPETDFGMLNATADLVKSTVKAKYEDEDWLQLAGNLSDKIREHQKQALIAYLLTKQELMDWGAKDADGLFEYFLIDVQMGSCMNTSRIVQANAAVQMYVNRCLLNLESHKVLGVEKGVSPDAIDKERWEWMEYYRVWEVNKKIFLYPENWLEPEWRDDRSPFFKDLESELTQNDITDRSVETAFRNYLTKLNTVANLDVCGMYQENYPNGNMRFLHVFGRTHNAPYQFFYRTCNEFNKWGAWEKVPVDIRMTEEGDHSGVHLMPVVWKNRLFVFWTEFVKKQEEKVFKVVETRSFFGAEYTVVREATVEEMSNFPPSDIKADEYYEVRLGWTEYVDGKWNAKQLSKEFIKVRKIYLTQISGLALRMNILWENQMVIWLEDDKTVFGNFFLTDIQSELGGFSWLATSNGNFKPKGYSNFYMLHKKSGALEFKGLDYLKKPLLHKLLFSTKVFDFEPTLKYPFFYNAYNRTYFVRPVDVRVYDHVISPGLNKSFIVENYINSVLPLPQIVPFGPDDLFSNVKNDAFLDRESAALDLVASRSFRELKTASAQVIPESFAAGNQGAKIALDYSSPALKSQLNILDGVKLGRAFADKLEDYPYFNAFHLEKGFEFHTFYHPFSSQFVTNLNNFGIDGLMNSDTFLNIISDPFFNDYGTVFVSNHDPNFSQGLVKKAPASNAYKPGEAYTYYKENICFDVFGANSIYNWELFFHAPLYIANRLSKNGRFEEARKWFHYIFDPTTNELPAPGQSETSRYWKVLPFKTTVSENLEAWFEALGASNALENPIIKEWRDDPFKPFAVARNRPLAFMKNVVIKYVENLREWGDSLFRMFTRESVNEALQLYVMANHILGPLPEFVPKRGEIKAETYDSLKDKWDDFSNALVELENIFPYSSTVPVSGGSSSGPGLLGIGPELYFCIPPNDKLMEHWGTIADRLYKIRHCMDIDGVERQLALFSPPIDPAMLINAAAQGISLGSILSDLSSPPPIYRFTYLIQKANEFCSEVKSLGSSLLSVLEKKDGEELGRLRASQETAILDLMTAVKERQVLDARVSKEGLLKSRETAAVRLEHYNALLSTEAVAVPAPPTIDADVNSESQLPVDTAIVKFVPDVDQSLVDADEAGIKIINKEKQDLEKANESMIAQQVASGMESLAGGLHLIPQIGAHATPIGVGAVTGFGGVQLGGATSAAAKVPAIIGSVFAYEAANAAKMAGFIRREQEWTLQANLAAKEIIQLDKQITSADIKIQITNKELDIHKQQIEDSKQVEQFLKDKFTNQELYQWMKEQLFFVYKQGFNMAYDMAKKVEKCYQYEMGKEATAFIQYGYWDNTMQGLCSGEKLQLALRQLEFSYLEENKRELELTKSISMALLNPLALQELRTTGKCFLSIPEELFDLDYQGHYFRRIKSVSLSLPCIAGPYTTVNCTLRLLKNTVRINTSTGDGGAYEHNNDEGVWIDDIERFRENNVPVKAIATSTGQRDSGMFELNFRDERYLPFEGAGAISDWKIELTQDAELRQFDYATISDVIIHLSYTACEDAGLFKDSAVTRLKGFLTNAAKLSKQPLIRMFNMKQEFSSEWYKFLNPPVAGADQVLSITLQREHFPFFSKERAINVKKVEVLIKANRPGDYKMILAAKDVDDNAMTSSEISMPESATYANMQMATLRGTTTGINVEGINAFSPISLKFRHNSDISSPQKYNEIDTNPEEISDIFVVLHYALGELSI